jgi:predicted cation transporter
MRSKRSPKNHDESEETGFLEVKLVSPIPPEPVLSIVLGLSAVALMVLILPFKVKKIEENLEPFFLVMGATVVTISGLWSWKLVLEALRAPVMIGSMPIGIFQVVLLVGLLIHFFNMPFCNAILHLAKKLGPTLFIFLLITVFGLLSSVISVILTACLLAEITAALPFSRKNKIKLVVLSCFGVGLGAVLTPLGEPLSTILVAKLSGPPYYAGFFFPVKIFGLYMILGVVATALFGALWLGPKISSKTEGAVTKYTETVKTVILRAVKVFTFVAALVLLGEGFRPLIVWYFTKISAGVLYWFNTISAILDNATLTAIEIGPAMSLSQITGIIMGLSIAGGMLIPGNIPNIVAAGRLKISMKEWAVIGLPIGLVMMAIYFVILYVL